MQMYVLGGSIGNEAGESSTQISVVSVNDTTGMTYTYPADLSIGRSQFSAVTAPLSDIVACGGLEGATCEVVVPCPPGYYGPNCTTPSAALCTYGYYRSSDGSSCLAW